MLSRMLSLCSLLLLCLAGQAATDIFMKIDGIPGESQDARHPNEIVLTGYSFDFTQSASPTAGGGGGTGKVAISPFTATKPIDASSPRLALAVASGQHLRQVNITVRRSGREQFEFLHIILTDVMISRFAQENTSAGMPEEVIGMTFATIEIEYIPQLPTGAAGTPVKMKWDVRRNMPG